MDDSAAEPRQEAASREAERQRSEAGSRELGLERCLAALSRRLVAAAGDEVPPALAAALEASGQAAAADRVWLELRDEGEPALRLDWAAPGAPASVAPWAALAGDACLLRGEARILDTDQHASADDELAIDARRRGVQSLIALPVSGGRLGALVYETTGARRRWSERERNLLGVVAGLLAGALQRRRTDQALRESEARFRAFAEHAIELIAELDEVGCYLYVSPSYRELLGYEPEELLGRNSGELVHPDDVLGSAELMAEALRRGGRSHRVHRLRHRDGSWRWFDNTGRAYRTPRGEHRFVSIGRDITERRRIEQTLERQLAFEQCTASLSRRLFELRGEEVAEGIQSGLGELARLLGAQRGYLFSFAVEPGAWEHFEWCASGIAVAAPRARPWSTAQVLRGEVLAVESLDDLPPEAAEERRDLAARGARSLLAVPVRSERRLVGLLGFEYPGTRRFDAAETMRLRVVGELLASALRRRRSEQALLESEAQLFQAQKMEAVGRLAGGVAHDFNNLLTVIGGNTEWLLDRAQSADPLRADLLEIRRAVERATGLTRQLLAFGRREPYEPRPVDLAALVHEVEGLLRRVIGEDVELEQTLPETAPFVEADPGRLEQVLVNLAVNARDAMPRGGQLHIALATCCVEAGEADRLGLPKPGRYALLSVKDAGSGIDAATRTRIFEPFFTTKEPDKGSGLGLSIVYGVVRECGGSISVASEPGEGAEFRVHLPLVEASVETTASALRGASTRRGSETVLVVEDEPSVRRLLRRNLEAAGYRVLEGADGASALAVAAAHEGPIDLLLSDVVMPGMRGGELAERLQRERPELRVLFVSGHPKDSAEGEELLPDAPLLEKPLARDPLLRAVREQLDARLSPAESPR